MAGIFQYDRGRPRCTGRISPSCQTGETQSAGVVAGKFGRIVSFLSVRLRRACEEVRRMKNLGLTPRAKSPRCKNELPQKSLAALRLAKPSSWDLRENFFSMVERSQLVLWEEG